MCVCSIYVGGVYVYLWFVVWCDVSSYKDQGNKVRDILTFPNGSSDLLGLFQHLKRLKKEKLHSESSYWAERFPFEQIGFEAFHFALLSNPCIILSECLLFYFLFLSLGLEDSIFFQNSHFKANQTVGSYEAREGEEK